MDDNSQMLTYMDKCFNRVHAMLEAELKKPDSSPTKAGLLLDIETMLVDTAREVHEETVNRTLSSLAKTP